eukprot:1568993-Prymnesium_polylepis.3
MPHPSSAQQAFPTKQNPFSKWPMIVLAVCTSDKQYFDGGEHRCLDCPPAGKSAARISTTCLIIVVHLAVLSWCAKRMRQNRCPSQLVSLITFVARLKTVGILPSFKLVFAFVQIVGLVPKVYNLVLPEQYKGVFDAMGNLNPIDIILDLPCQGGYHTELLIQGMAPMALIGIALLSGMMWSVFAKRGNILQDFVWKKAFLKGVPLALVLTFAIVPSISTKVFGSFNCINYQYDYFSGEKKKFLISDFSVECYTEPHDQIRMTAYIFIFLWP